MALPSTLWTDMNINPHNTRNDYLNNWGDCQDVALGGVSFYTNHYTANTQQHYTDENPTFQALAAREAALAHKIDRFIDAVEDDFIKKDVANDANIWLSKAAAVEFTAQTSAGHAKFVASGATDSIFDMVAGSGASNHRYLRLINSANYLKIQRMDDAGTSVLATPFDLSTLGHLVLGQHLTTNGYINAGGTVFPTTGGVHDLGGSGVAWRDIWISGDCHNSWIPTPTNTYSLGTSVNRWQNLHVSYLYVYSAVETDLIPDISITRDLGSVGINWLNIYSQNSYHTGVVTAGEIGSHLIPTGTYTFDLGSSLKRWDRLFLDGFASVCQPSTDLGQNLGNSVRRWATTYTNNLFVYSQVYTSLIPNGAAQDLGSATNRWLNVHQTNTYTTTLTSWGGAPTYLTLTANYLRSASDHVTYLGSSARRWQAVYADAYLPFTGSHYSILSKKSKMRIEKGMIAVSTGKVYVEDISNTIVEVTTTNKKDDPCVYGIFVREIKNISDDPSLKEKDKETPIVKLAGEGNEMWYINALGEGQLAVVATKKYEPKNGDLLSSSVVPGYATTQDDDVFHSYTIGKVTQNIDWSKIKTTIKYKGKTYKKTLIAVTYHCG